MPAEPEASSSHSDATADDPNRAASHRKPGPDRSPRQRARAAGVALGALALTSAASANLAVPTSPSAMSAQLSAGRLAITLSAHEVFKLDICTTDDTGNSATDPTDTTTTSNNDSTGIDETPTNNDTSNTNIARIRILEPLPVNVLAYRDDREESSSESSEHTNPLVTVTRIYAEINTAEAEDDFRTEFTPANVSSTRTAQTPYYIPDVGWVDREFASSFREQLESQLETIIAFDTTHDSLIGLSYDHIDDHLDTLHSTMPQAEDFESDETESSELGEVGMRRESNSNNYLGDEIVAGWASPYDNFSNNNALGNSGPDYGANAEPPPTRIQFAEPYPDVPDYEAMSVAALEALNYDNISNNNN
ncbi:MULTISPECIES: hypothetical protein [Mycobacterium]|uniref:Uncharacterized protein n=2 Tax=Mycobacterium TaxID=1763 RepID=A0A7G1INT3_MYCKA|nr:MULTISPECIES: hypothetical protein [Mycobacterium]BCI91483.1 hypothetical protein NIIDMKKI_66890 [Mycobacterium kansasii]